MPTAQKGKAGKPSVKRRKTDDRSMVWVHFITHTFTFLTSAIMWTAIVFVVYFVYRTVGGLAGRTTMADIGIRVLGNFSVSSALAWSCGGSGVVFGLKQRRLRKNTISRLEGRLKCYEQLLDPSRSSSLLTPTGDTNPQDLP